MTEDNIQHWRSRYYRMLVIAVLLGVGFVSQLCVVFIEKAHERAALENQASQFLNAIDALDSWWAARKPGEDS